MEKLECIHGVICRSHVYLESRDRCQAFQTLGLPRVWPETIGSARTLFFRACVCVCVVEVPVPLYVWQTLVG